MRSVAIVSLFFLSTLSLTVLVVAGDASVDTTTESVQESEVVFIGANNLTQEQVESVVTIEVVPSNATDLSEAEYRRIRQRIIVELNKRRRRRRRTRSPTSSAALTTAEQPPTTMTLPAASTVEEELTTLERTVAETTAAEETIAPTTEAALAAATTGGQMPAAITTAAAAAITAAPTEPPFEWTLWKRRRRSVVEAASPRRRQRRHRRTAVDPMSDDYDDEDYYDDYEDDYEYTEDDLQFIILEPPLSEDGKLRISFVVDRKDTGKVLDGGELLDVTKSLQESGELDSPAGAAVDAYRGLPVDHKTAEQVQAGAALDWRFYLVVIIIVVLFVLVVCAFFCVRHRSSRPEAVDDSNSPIIVPETVEPAFGQPNGSGPKPLHDDDCYIVLYDEMLLAVSEPPAQPARASEHTRL